MITNTSNYHYNMPDRDEKVKVEILNQNTENIDTDLAALAAIVDSKAPINSPQFSGKVMAPKPGTESGEHLYEQVVTTGYVQDALEVENLDLDKGTL